MGAKAGTLHTAHAAEFLAHNMRGDPCPMTQHCYGVVICVYPSALQVVELGGERVLIVSVDNTVYAVSNKCSHLGLPLVGKTALLQVGGGQSVGMDETFN